MKNKTDFAYQAVYRYLLRLVGEAQGTTPIKLPSLRRLARRLQVSISTVQSAYSLLEKEGRVCSVPKSGYYSVPEADDNSAPELTGKDEHLLELLYRSVRRPGMSLLSVDEPSALQTLGCPLLSMERELERHYPRPRDFGFQPFGDIELRAALAARYTCTAEQGWYAENVYIGPDLSGMLKAVIDILALRGSTVVVESPCSWTLLRLLKAFEIRVIELPLGKGGGIDLALLAQALLEQPVGLVLLSSVLNPVSGSARPACNTRAAAALLNAHKVWVLENDSHGDLLFAKTQGRLRDLIDPQRLIVLGSFAKTLGPEAPYGYLLCKGPERQWQHYFLVRAFELSPIRQKAIARLCVNGRLDAHLGGLIQVLAERMAAMTQQLDQHLGHALRYDTPAGGSGIWAESVRPVNMREVFESLLRQRIVITPGELFSVQGWHRQYLRIGYGLDWTLDPDPLLAALGEALEGASRSP